MQIGIPSQRPLHQRGINAIGYCTDDSVERREGLAHIQIQFLLHADFAAVQMPAIMKRIAVIIKNIYNFKMQPFTISKL